MRVGLKREGGGLGFGTHTIYTIMETLLRGDFNRGELNSGGGDELARPFSSLIAPLSLLNKPESK